MADFGTIDIYVYRIDIISHKDREELNNLNLIRSIRKNENSLCYVDLEILGFGNIIISFFPIFTDIGINLIKSKYIRQYPFFITKIKKYSSFFYKKVRIIKMSILLTVIINFKLNCKKYILLMMHVKH